MCINCLNSDLDNRGSKKTNSIYTFASEITKLLTNNVKEQ